jgi:hypothetical protein
LIELSHPRHFVGLSATVSRKSGDVLKRRMAQYKEEEDSDYGAAVILGPLPFGPNESFSFELM